MTKTSYLLALVIAGLPGVALAAVPGAAGINLGAIQPYSTGIINVINQILVPLIVGLSFITFLWGLYKYFILGASEEAEKAEGRKFAMWGIIGFVVILSVWGIVNLTRDVLGLGNTSNPNPPTFTVPTP
ncbi:MAG: hypothetical protein RLZZ26_404 [Candidatus Parcubacteria bacterium]|jgi:hypothetical protein